jgi:hypothetical protein
MDRSDPAIRVVIGQSTIFEPSIFLKVLKIMLFDNQIVKQVPFSTLKYILCYPDRQQLSTPAMRIDPSPFQMRP